jgi:large subunit ribosomal protein L13
LSIPAGDLATPAPLSSNEERAWWVVDATGLVLGRLAAQVAHVLRGKHKPTFAPHKDVGDFVVVVNASKVRLTGNKLDQKVWYRHSGYPGGLRAIGYGHLMDTRPDVAVEKAVRGMLPHNRLGRSMAHKLKVYNGPDHPHAAQKPQPMTIRSPRQR